jgi:hypothetical protein
MNLALLFYVGGNNHSERSFENDEEDKVSGGSSEHKGEEEKIPDSKLESGLQDFVKLIFNTQ